MVHEDPWTQRLNRLSEVDRAIAGKVGLDETATYELGQEGITMKEADAIATRAAGRQVKDPSRYATTGARRVTRGSQRQFSGGEAWSKTTKAQRDKA